MKPWILAALLASACGRAAVAPAPAVPLPAAPAVTLRPVADECQAVLAALDAHAACAALTSEQRADLAAWRERAAIDLAAGQDPQVDAATSHRLALACHDAAAAVQAAAARCANAPPIVE
jgi:hypothetical protein